MSDKSHQLLSLAVEGGRIGTWYWSIETNEFEWSELCREYLELPPEATPSFEHFYSVLHPEDRERVEGLMAVALDTGTEHYQAEYRVLRPDGTIRWLSAPGRVFLNAEGRPYAMAGIVIDITERNEVEQRLRQAQEALAFSEQRFRLAMKATREGLWDWRLDTRQAYYSPAYATMLGYAPEDIAPHIDGWLKLLHPDDAETVVTEVQERLRDPGRYSLEFRMRHADGGYRWILSRGRTVSHDRTGLPLRAIGTHQDITERKMAEMPMRENVARFQRVYRHAPIGIVISNPQGLIMECNPAFEAIIGYPEAELRGTHLTSLLHPDDRAANLAAFQRLLKGEGESFAMENRYLCQDGHSVWVRKIVSWIPDDVGMPAHLLTMVQDITDRKEAEDQLRASEIRFRALVTASPNVVYRMSPDWIEMYDLVGQGFIADSSPSSRAWLDLYIPEEDQPRVRAAIAEAIQTRDIFDLEHRVWRVDGSLGWTHSRAVPILDDAGHIVEWFGMASDVTSRKALDMELQESRHFLELALEGAELSAWNADLVKGWFRCDRRGGAMLGLVSSELELTHDEWLRRIHPDDRDAVLETIRAHQAGETRLFESEHRLHHQAGHWVWVLARSLSDFRVPPRKIGALNPTPRARADELYPSRS